MLFGPREELAPFLRLVRFTLNKVHEEHVTLTDRKNSFVMAVYGKSFLKFSQKARLK